MSATGASCQIGSVIEMLRQTAERECAHQQAKVAQRDVKVHATPKEERCTRRAIGFEPGSNYSPSVRSVRYLRPILRFSSFDEPSPPMKFSRQLPF
jgi:hypothetical protein